MTVRTVAGKFRIVDVETGRITPNVAGDPVDRGGGSSQQRRRELETQTRAINARLAAKRAEAVASGLEAREATAAKVRRKLAEAKHTKRDRDKRRKR